MHGWCSHADGSQQQLLPSLVPIARVDHCSQQRSASGDRVVRWLGQTVAALTGEVLRDEWVAIVSVEIAIEAVGAA